jgi:hypothetical protein
LPAISDPKVLYSFINQLLRTFNAYLDFIDATILINGKYNKTATNIWAIAWTLPIILAVLAFSIGLVSMLSYIAEFINYVFA